MSTITLTGAYGQTQYRVSGLAPGTLINADNASWIIDNSTSDGDGTNLYPILIYNSPGVTLDGGVMHGEVSQTAEWRDIYVNSAGIRVESSPNAVIRDWRIDKAWDGIRTAIGTSNFLIEDVWLSGIRDDAVENDRLNGGTIRDSLFDGAFVGISLDPGSSSPADGHNNTVTLDHVLIRLQNFLYEGEMTHEGIFKTDSSTPNTLTPSLRVVDCVFAIEDVTHHSYRSMFDAWAKTVESHGNVFLNLSDTPLPSNYPMPPSGFTILQGQAARDYWVHARDTWVAEHTGTPPPPPPPPPDPDPPPPDPSEVFTFDKRIVSNSDDAEQRGSSVDLTSSDLELVKDGSTLQQVGLRFTGIAVPHGATITKAYVQFTCDETGSTAIALTIKGNDVDDAATFANTTFNLSGRAMTDTFTNWSPAAWTTVGEAGLNQRTPDLAAVIQEIVSRDGWVSGNDLALIISGSGTRTAEAFESGANLAPLLHLEYTVPDLLLM